MDTISIIMPIYNTREFLEDSIQSVLDQTYQNFELLLINDNSNDNSKQFIEEIAKTDERIKTFHLPSRIGVGAARNFGIEKSTGDFIYFLDSDDFLSPETLQILVKSIGKYDFISGKQIQAHLSEDLNKDLEDQNDDSEDDLEEEIMIYTDEKYRLIRNNSALNRLFKTKFVKNNNLQFSESVKRFSDLSFMIPALLNTEETPYLKSCLYHKRRRNDPLNNPALMQAEVDLRVTDFVNLYNHLKDLYKDEFVHAFLDRQLINYYRRPVIRFFRKNENVDLIFDVLHVALNRIDNGILNNYSYMVRKEITTIQRGNIQKFKKVNLRHHRIRKLRRALTGRRKLFIQLYRVIFLKLQMKEKTVVFESFLGKSYSDSPKYIYEYMINNNMDYNYVWIFNEKKKIPGNATQVKRNSLRYFYHLARAKYWVSNSRLPITLNKREGNVYLQTWHGTPLKQLVFDMKDVYSADPKYKSNFFRQSRRWDFLSSPNAYSSEIFRRAFKYEKEMLEFGYPRNDILYQKNTPKDIKELKTKMQIPTNKKVVLYAPTWRDDEFFERGKYKFTLQLELDRLQEKLGDEYIVLLRMHYFIANQLEIEEYKGFVYDFSSYDDIAELYLVSDILITDYSSVFFDFANLKRPILFYTYDLENYRDKLRGFYLDIEKDVPGPLLRTTEEVIHSINNIDDIQKNYEAKYEAFYNRFCEWDDGTASERTVQAVFNKD